MIKGFHIYKNKIIGGKLMKTYSVEYREAYSRSYTVEAESPEEAEEKILNGIGEGSYPPPEECVGSWCTIQNFEEESADFLKNSQITKRGKSGYKTTKTGEYGLQFQKLMKCIIALIFRMDIPL